MDIKVAFGAVLKDYRIRRNFSQEQMALESDLDRTYISLLERGKRQPTLTTLFRLSGTLGVSASELVAETQKRLHPDPSSPSSPPTVES
jgi:transcriptional regulator with XRE-family HTH domain